MVFSFLPPPSSFLENKGNHKVKSLRSMTFVTTQPNVQVQWPSLLQKFKDQCSKFKVMKKDTWKFIIQTVAAILTAIATSLGVTSCIAG